MLALEASPGYIVPDCVGQPVLIDLPPSKKKFTSILVCLLASLDVVLDVIVLQFSFYQFAHR